MSQDIKNLMKKLLDTSGRCIQCSNSKSSGFVFVSFEEAIDYNFIRFGNRYFIPAISIDIDSHQNLKYINSILINNKLPTPNFIVKTSKGLHIHWILDSVINVNGYKQLHLYQHIANSLVDIFKSDKNAIPKKSGRMFRNPLKHDHIFFTKKLYSLSDFTHILSNKDDKIVENILKRPVRHTINDFTKIGVGSRNNSLFDYGRHIAYSNHNNPHCEDILYKTLMSANLKLPEPLDSDEIKSIVTSIMTFIRTKYNNRTTNKKTIEFNRRLSKKMEALKKAELFEKWVTLGFLTVKHIKKLSNRGGGRVFNVHKNTFAKHRPFLIQAIKDLVFIVKNTAKNFTFFTYNYNYSYNLNLNYKKYVTVNSKSPPNFNNLEHQFSQYLVDNTHIL